MAPKSNDDKTITSQRDKFVNQAKQLETDESEERFDEALKRVGKAKLTHPPRPKEKKPEGG